MKILVATILFAFVACEQKANIQTPPMTSDILSIEHMEYGLEQFKVSSARYNLYQADDGIWEFVVSVTTEDPIIRSKELVDIIHAQPNFEATAILLPDDLKLIPGRVILQKQGYDYKRDENLSNIYYSSHESIEDLRLELINVTDEWIEINLTGAATITGSNGLKPDSNISVLTRFHRDKSLKRGIY